MCTMRVQDLRPRVIMLCKLDYNVSLATTSARLYFCITNSESMIITTLALVTATLGHKPSKVRVPICHKLHVESLLSLR